MYNVLCTSQPSGTSTDRLGILYVNPRIGTHSALDLLSGRTSIVEALW